MFRTFLFMIMAFCSFFLASKAQDYSNRGLMMIKEESEARRMGWNKAFDEAAQSKVFTSLAQLRQSNEAYLALHLSAISRLYAEGDGRSLLTAISNYLQIERQFVKNVMVPAEALNAGSSQTDIENIYQKITEFSQKEKMFLIDINNAIATSPDITPAIPDPEMNQEDEEADEPVQKRGSMVGEKAKEKKRKKLPHEVMDEKQKGEEDESGEGE